MNVLIYSPDLIGHPQVYCRVITDILLDLDCHVILVVGSADDHAEQAYLNLRPFLGHKKITILDCKSHSPEEGRYLSADVITNIQKSYAVDVTLFIEADKFRDELLRIGEGSAPRLLGRNIGIFARTSAWYPGEEFYSGAKIKWYGPNLRSTLGKLKRGVTHSKQTDKYFYETNILKQKALDAILVKDERITQRFGPPVYWMPEIFKPFDDYQSVDEEKEFDEISAGYSAYLSKQSEREVLLFFGRGAWYRGFDYFLKLLDLDPSICGVHCGAASINEEGKEYEFNVEELRHKLANEGRLFETNRYINSWKLISLFFSTATRLVCTHRLTGSSGNMLQALDAGKPVLVPDSGLLGYRVRNSNIGELYRYSDISDLYNRWLAFKQRPADSYSQAIDRFMQKFSRDSLFSCIQDVVFNS